MKRSDDAQHNTETSVRARTSDDAQVVGEQERGQEVVEDATR
jgi:hypothetical protein